MNHIDYLFESSHPGGTYASILPSVESKEQLLNFCKNLGIDNLVDSRDLHCTITYSRSPAPDIAHMDFELPCSAIATNFAIFGTDTKVLVLELYCPHATRLHQTCVSEYGATHDFDEYRPHITVASDFTGKLPIDLPDFDIEFTGFSVEELD